MSGYEWIIDVVLVGGVALVVAAATRSLTVWWRLVAVTTAIALVLAPSPWAGAFALPWLLVAGVGAVRVARSTLAVPVRSWTLALLPPAAIAGWTLVAGWFLL